MQKFSALQNQVKHVMHNDAYSKFIEEYVKCKHKCFRSHVKDYCSEWIKINVVSHHPCGILRNCYNIANAFADQFSYVSLIMAHTPSFR